MTRLFKLASLVLLTVCLVAEANEPGCPSLLLSRPFVSTRLQELQGNAVEGYDVSQALKDVLNFGDDLHLLYADSHYDFEYLHVSRRLHVANEVSVPIYPITAATLSQEPALIFKEPLKSAFESQGVIHFNSGTNPYNFNVPVYWHKRFSRMASDLQKKHGVSVILHDNNDLSGTGATQNSQSYFDSAKNQIHLAKMASLESFHHAISVAMQWKELAKFNADPQVHDLQMLLLSIKADYKSWILQELTLNNNASSDLEKSIQSKIESLKQSTQNLPLQCTGREQLKNDLNLFIKEKFSRMQILSDQINAIKSKRSWRQWEQQRRSAIHTQLRYHHSTYFTDENRLHPHVRALHYEGQFSIDPDIYSLQKLSERQETNLAEAINDGLISESETIRFVRFYKSRNGVYTPVPYGQIIPKGATPVAEGLPAETFIEMVDRGYYPLGENVFYEIADANEIAIKPFQDYLTHDLAHKGILEERLRLMAATRLAFSSIRSRGDRLELNGETTPLGVRMFIAQEVMSTIEQKKFLPFLKLSLVLPGNFNEQDSVVTIDQIQKAIVDLNLTPSNLNRLAQTVLTNYRQSVLHVGGSVRDLITSQGLQYRSEKSLFQDGALQSLYYQLETILAPTDGIAPAAIAVQTALARLLSVMIASSQITPERWMLEASQSKIETTDKLYRLYCLTGAWSKEHKVYKAHCH